MKSTELRIGNLVDYEKTTHTITSVDESMSSSNWTKKPLNNHYEHRNDELQPILITEEFLLKFGFDWFDLLEMKVYRNKSIVYVSVNDGIFKCGIKMSPSEKYTPINLNIRYVHTFQNLYFALTGEELK